MPAILLRFEWANFPHPDVPFRAHRWHARQSTTTSSSSSTSNDITTFIVIFAIVFVFALCASVVRCLKRAQLQRLSHVAPRPVVQAPPGSRRGPVVAEILAVIQAAVVARQLGNRDVHGAVSSSAPIDAQYPPEAMLPPSRPTQTNRLPLVHGSDRRSRTPLDADVAQADDPPPPYASISLA